MSVRLAGLKPSWSNLPRWRVILGLLLIPLVPALVSAWVNPPRSLAAREGETSVVVAQGWPEVLWVDARAEAAYAQEHVPGAINLSPPSWDAQVGAVIAAWRPERQIVVYCDGHGCQASRDVAQRLRAEMGLTEVYVLTGGWDAWLGGRK
jgi:rhodanese-related sulfurtransferase